MAETPSGDRSHADGLSGPAASENPVSLLDRADGVVARVASRERSAVAECVVRMRVERSAKVRAGRLEMIEEVGTRSLGLRVICGRKTGLASTNDSSDAGIDRLVAQALDIAAVSEPDPTMVESDAAELRVGSDVSGLDLHDPRVSAMPTGDLIARALDVEAETFRLDARIRADEGATCRAAEHYVAYRLAGRFRGAYRTSLMSLHVVAAATGGDGRRCRASRGVTARHLADLESGCSVGGEAARRALAKLGARGVSACEVPVIFAPSAAALVLRTMAQCVMGGAVWRRSSYLAGREGSRVASDLVTVVDDALIHRGVASRPFDGEGMASRRTIVIEKGVLRNYLCDTYAAGKLDRRSTASAVRGASGGISAATTNFLLEAGTETPDAIIEGTRRGFYVTEVAGYGFNPVSGDFSRAASGFWIEGGERAFPLTEMTIAAKIDDLWQRVDAVGSDLRLTASTASPTLRVGRMSVAGPRP